MQRTQTGTMSNPHFGYQGFRSAGQILAPSLKPGAHAHTYVHHLLFCMRCSGWGLKITAMNAHERKAIHLTGGTCMPKWVSVSAWHLVLYRRHYDLFNRFSEQLLCYWLDFVLFLSEEAVRCLHDNYAELSSPKDTPHSFSPLIKLV